MRPPRTPLLFPLLACCWPLAGQTQTPAPVARYYVGLAAYGGYYQNLAFNYRGARLPVQLTVGYQWRPRLAVQASVVYSSYASSYFDAGRYYSGSAAAANPYAFYEYTGQSSRYNTSLALLLRYTLTRQPTHRFQADVLGGLTLEHQRYRGSSTNTSIDSTRTTIVTAHDEYERQRTYLLLSAGLGARYRFGRHLEANLDFLLNQAFHGYAQGLTGSAALGLRYRFGGLR